MIIPKQLPSPFDSDHNFARQPQRRKARLKLDLAELCISGLPAQEDIESRSQQVRMHAHDLVGRRIDPGHALKQQGGNVIAEPESSKQPGLFGDLGESHHVGLPPLGVLHSKITVIRLGLIARMELVRHRYEPAGHKRHAVHEPYLNALAFLAGPILLEEHLVGLRSSNSQIAKGLVLPFLNLAVRAQSLLPNLLERGRIWEVAEEGRHGLAYLTQDQRQLALL